MGILSVLTIIFAIAQLLGFISWSWWLVLTPLLIEVLIVVAILTIGIITVWRD